MFLKLNKYVILVLILLISSIFLFSTNLNKVTGFVTKAFGEKTIMKVLSDEQGNTIKTLKNEIFIAIIADKDNCVDNKFRLYQEGNKIKEVEITNNKICEKTTIKYKPELPYGSYTLAAIDINTENELKSDFQL